MALVVLTTVVLVILSALGIFGIYMLMQYQKIINDVGYVLMENNNLLEAFNKQQEMAMAMKEMMGEEEPTTRPIGF